MNDGGRRADRCLITVTAHEAVKNTFVVDELVPGVRVKASELQHFKPPQTGRVQKLAMYPNHTD